MASRVALVLVTLFWVSMNALLWRAEYAGRSSAGSAVPAALVWQKMLTAPDSSSLSILNHGKKIGFCHWMTSVGEELSQLSEAEGPPEGMVKKMTGYRIQLEGNLALEDSGSHVRFDGNLKLTTNQIWQEFALRLNLRPTVLEIRSAAAEQSIHLQTGEGSERSERVIKFSDLQNPDSLFAEFGGAVASGIWSNLGLPASSAPGANVNLGLNWEARNDSVKIGHAQVRAYRLQTHLLDRFQAVIFVSTVGEILRVE